MNRLQKKCFIASAGAHLLLVVVLLAGPALAPRSKPDNLPVLDFVAYKTVDALVSGGGEPTAKPPPPQPAVQPTVQPAPPPEKRREPEPVKEPTPEVKAAKPEPEPVEPSEERKPRKPEISTTPVTRPPDARAAAKAAAEASAAADGRRRLAREAAKLAERIGSEMSGETSVALYGPGGGGVPYANFLQAVKSRYANAWIVPDGVTDDEATAVASVTIARDGSVLAARITRSSGSVAVDRSVQETLDKVKFAAPLPENAKEDQRTVTINFNVKARRSLG